MRRAPGIRRRTRVARRAPALLAPALLALAAFLALRLGALAGAAAAEAAAARPVEVTLRFDAAFLQRLFAERVFGGPGGRLRLRSADRCSGAELLDPRVAPAPGEVRIAASARAHAGLALGAGCWRALGWRGELRLALEPRLEGEAPRVGFRLASSEFRPGRARLLPEAWLWRRIEPAFRDPFEAVRIDVAPLLDLVREAIPLFARAEDRAAAARMAASLALERVAADAGGVSAVLRFEAPAGARPVQAAPEAPLDAAELAALERALGDWDAFLTFVVKQAGRDAAAPALDRELLDVLLDARHDLVWALADPAPRGQDPVRALFVRSWGRLAPLLREVDADVGAEGALRYLAFVAAGDALAALDAAAPAFGLEISADGLRRLARTLVPDARVDPLARSDAVDPELRALFGFGPALAEPAPPAEGAAPAPRPAPDAGPTPPEAPPPPDAAPRPPDVYPPPDAAPRPPDLYPPPDAPPPAPDLPAPPDAAPSSDLPAPPEAPPPAPSPAPPSSLGPGAARAWLPRLAGALGALLVAPAHAAPAFAPPLVRAAPDPALGALAARLNRWAPSPADAPQYVPLAGKLLRAIAGELVRELPGELRGVYPALVLATAWQESCWRQYVRRGAALAPLRSPAGAVGLMQVHERVWRGFYDVDGLRHDVAYNGRAGGEILRHYLRDHAFEHEEQRHGGARALARSAYAMYNGGPSQRARWRSPKTPAALRAIDAAFLRKYEAMRDGDEAAVLACFSG